MRITVDLRSLQNGLMSGVENYTLNLVESLLSVDRNNQYTFFYSGWKKNSIPDLSFVNAKTKHIKWPNKLLNLGFKSGLLKVERLCGPSDCLFLPNLSQYDIEKKTKLFLTVHDLSPLVTPEFYDTKRRLWHSFLNYKRSFQRANAIFAVSQYTKCELVRLFDIPERKIHVVYPALDDKFADPEPGQELMRAVRNKYFLPASYILFVNTIEPRKNLEGLIKAYERLETEIELVIAGKPGWRYKSIFKQISQSPKKSKIRYLNYIPENEKAALIKMSRVLAYPSFYEGFGFQPLEAAALGVPVVVGSLTSLPEVLGEGAIMANPYNLDEISRALKEAVENEELRESVIGKAKKRAALFNWKKSAKEILSIIESI